MAAFAREPLSVKISFRVTEREHQLLKSMAGDGDVVDVIRNALDAYLTPATPAKRDSVEPLTPAAAPAPRRKHRRASGGK
jgi:hypothetical protein